MGTKIGTKQMTDDQIIRAIRHGDLWNADENATPTSQGMWSENSEFSTDYGSNSELSPKVQEMLAPHSRSPAHLGNIDANLWDADWLKSRKDLAASGVDVDAFTAANPDLPISQSQPIAPAQSPTVD